MSLDWTSPDLAFLASRLRSGSVNLFLGAGFSVDAVNEEEGTPPLGAALAKRLAEEASIPFENEPLPVVWDVVEKRVGSTRLNDVLSKLYTVKGAARWYGLLRTFVWRRIFTTNIDNLLEHVYRTPGQQVLQPIICPAPPSERDALFRDVQCVHLHGHVLHPQRRKTFTLDDFARQTTSTNPWYTTLVDEYQTQPVIFIGTLAEESPLFHYMQLREPKDDSSREYRPKSFLINRTIGPIRSDALRSRNIVPIEATAQEFFEGLRAALPEDDTSLAIVRRTAFPHVYIRAKTSQRDEAVARYFDQIVPAHLPPEPAAAPLAFFLGAEPQWRDISENHDAKRDVNTALLDAIQSATSYSCIVLHGHGGSGKTTTAMRVAHDLATSGAQVYFMRTVERADFSGIIRLAGDTANSKIRLIIFVDVFTRHLGEVLTALPELSTHSHVSVILVDRSNAYFRKGARVAELATAEIAMPDLSRSDASAVIDRLSSFGVLGRLRNKSIAEQVDAFMERAERQMLVAMREATSGDGFVNIIRSEFTELPEEAQMAYAIVSLAVNAGAPGVYRKHLLPCLGGSTFRKGAIVETLLKGVLVPATSTGSMVKPRHRLIAQVVSDSVTSTEMNRHAIVRFLLHIAGEIVPKEIVRRTPAYLAYRGMVNCDALFELFSQDAKIVLGIYGELRSSYDGDFLFWLQFAMAQMRTGRLDVAENYLNQSLAIRPRNFQTLHQLGILFLTQAIQAEQPLQMVDRATDGIDLLAEQIAKRGEEDVYAYGAYLEYVRRWYEVAGDAISGQEWENLRMVGETALRIYGRDDYVRRAVQEVERTYMMRKVSRKP